MRDEKAAENNMPVPRASLDGAKHVSLCEALDRILDKGVVAAGGITVSVADIDLIYLGLNVVLCSAETARGDASTDSEGS